ncbi:MAG TPA: transposase [Albitalea sp.]|nr:transposase [Albitalea sp.]HJW10460.1 transposase [Albitalea sp.]
MASDRPASGTGSRRRYSAELQAQVMAECDAPGASVAKVAMSHGINANVVHRWRQLAREARPALATASGEFVPVSLPAMPPPTNACDIQIQLRRGATAMTITWPVSAAADFGAWMRELLR